MISIDGSFGEGGGQIIRSSLSLALCTGQPVTLSNIRAGRKKPGLLRQHLTCVNAAAEISQAEVSGAELGSSEVCFKPSNVKPGEYRFSINSAGSTSLVLQTVLLPLMRCSSASRVTITGGTHNGMAPSTDFLQKSFLPAMRLIGFEASIKLNKYGFYPAGGGEIEVEIQPVAATHEIEWMQGDLGGLEAWAISSQIPVKIGLRQLTLLAGEAGLSKEEVENRMVDSIGPGNMLSLAQNNRNLTALFESPGERGVSSEKVAQTVLQRWHSYRDSGAVVCEFLADQLLLPMALGSGGRFLTEKPSMHTLTNMHVIERFLPVKFDKKKITDNSWEISCRHREKEFGCLAK